MKKIIILGGSHRDIPLIKASQELGYFVITIGSKGHYLGHKYADKKYLVDFNNTPKVKEIFASEGASFFLPGSGEESYMRALEISNELGIGNFDKNEVAHLIHNKWSFKKFCLKNKIYTPNGLIYKDGLDLSKLEFPLIIKPFNLSGGRGVKVVKNTNELISAIKNSKKFSPDLFLEEFIEGRLIAYSVIIRKKQVAYSFIASDNTFINKYLITTAYKLEIPSELEKVMRNQVNKISHSLGLVDGMFHLQIIIKNNNPYLIDVTRRIPGDFFPNLIELSDGLSYSKAVVLSYLGHDFSRELKHYKRSKFVIRHCVMAEKNGIFSHIKIDQEIEKSIVFRFDIINENSQITNYMNEQIAIFLFSFDQEREDLCLKINHLVKAIII